MIWVHLYKIVLLRFFIYIPFGRNKNFQTLLMYHIVSKTGNCNVLVSEKIFDFSVIQNHFRKNVITFLLYRFFDLMFNPHFDWLPLSFSDCCLVWVGDLFHWLTQKLHFSQPIKTEWLFWGSCWCCGSQHIYRRKVWVLWFMS